MLPTGYFLLVAFLLVKLNIPVVVQLLRGMSNCLFPDIKRSPFSEW